MAVKKLLHMEIVVLMQSLEATNDNAAQQASSIFRWFYLFTFLGPSRFDL